MIVAIDGPSGSGKSTLGRRLARELGLLYIDTGAMYRAVALAVMESSVNATDDLAVGSLAARIEIDLAGDPDSLKVTLAGQDVTEQIRSAEVTRLSSVISAIPEVRRALVARQREMGRRGAVLEGRDIGTVVFPNADVKFFLTAAADARAQRRFAEKGEPNTQAGLAETLADMIERDRRDSNRVESPLKSADGAVVIDSTGLNIQEVFERMLSAVREKTGRMKDEG